MLYAPHSIPLLQHCEGKTSLAWQKLQLAQVRRAADSMTDAQTPWAVVLDTLTDDGKSVGVYDITCTATRYSVPTTAGHCF